MKITTLLSSVVALASIALIPSISDAKTPTINTAEGEINVATASKTVGANRANAFYFEPFNLVSFAYQGGFKDQGIPSGATLIWERQNRSITAEDLVRAAVNSNKLPKEVLNDQNYVSAVRGQLTSLYRDLSN